MAEDIGVPTLMDSDRDVIIGGDKNRIMKHLETYYARKSTLTMGMACFVRGPVMALS
ncbi:MAG: hypothetical protein NPIRA06_05580 [Nitrospirales bacterium]|nr:MAG: hypothetical protein NPIRA06_05580 [Nitrospirales bacterium]